MKYLKVSSQSNCSKLYFVNKGDKKYPIEAAAVTIPVAIVLVSLGKCFPTSETGTANAVTVLETVDLGTADAFNVTVHNNTALTSYTAPAKAMDFTFDNNDLVTTLSAGHTTKTETGDKAATVSIDGNAELASITIGFDDVEVWCRKHGLGVIHGGVNALRYTPHFNITTEEVDLVINITRRAIKHFLQ